METLISKYKEALERARKHYRETPNNVYKAMLEQIFPELKENEDERIRKRLIALVNSHGQGMYKDDMLVWLEKQCEKKSNPTGKSALEAINEVKLDNSNKIEPKFNVGDWITNGACTIQITSVAGKYYWHDNDCVGGDIKSIDKEYHLWTIADAKDGDILCTPNGNTFIFKTIDGDKILDYCGLYFNKFFSDSGSPNGSSTHYDKCNYRPATKEQRDNLFKKINEAGYVWYPNSKELYKLIRIHYD